MKKTSISYIAIAAIAVSACFNIEPETYIDGEGVVCDENSAEVTLNGAYSAMQQSEATFLLTMNYVADNVVLASAQAVIVPEITASGPAGYDPTHGGGYDYFYKTVNIANTIIGQLPLLSDELFSAGKKSQILGEAYFIRALSYFNLARTYGGVPLVLDPCTSASAADGIKKSSYDETLVQVGKDLDQAEGMLGSDTGDRSRISVWAVYALKARLALYRENWKDAETYASKLIGNAAFKLNDDPAAFFKTKGTDEEILELVFSNSDKLSIYTFYLPPTYGGRLDYIPNPTLSADLLDAAAGGTRAGLIGENPSSAGTYYISEYAAQDGSSSIHLLRLPEQYLIRAEARVKQSNLKGAAADIDVIRSRAGLSGTDASTADGLLLAIEEERRLELAFDGHRYSDVIRTGRASGIFGAYDSYFNDPRHWVLPFPYNAILADPDLEQNEDY